MPRTLLAALLAAALVSACDSGEAKKKSDEEKIAWPAAPSEGAPIVWEFVQLAGTGDKRSAKMRMFNFEDKTVTKVQATLHYLDASGTELDTFPWTQMGPNLIGAKGFKVAKVGAFLPEATQSVKATFESVEYDDGSSWKKTAS